MPSLPSLRAPCIHAILNATSGRNPMKYPGKTSWPVSISRANILDSVPYIYFH